MEIFIYFSNIFSIMLLIFQFFSTQIEDCFTQKSTVQLDIPNSLINVFLYPNQNQNCQFPDGIMGSLHFRNELLDITQVFNNYSYQNTDKISFTCIDCIKYDLVTQVSIVIDSIGLTSIFSAGSISNLKFDENDCSQTDLQIGQDEQIIITNITCLMISPDSTFNSSTFSILNNGVSILIENNGVISTNSTHLIIRMQNIEIYQLLLYKVYDTVLEIQGLSKNMYFTTKLTIQTFSFIGQLHFLTNLQLLINNDQLQYETDSNFTEILLLMSYFQKNNIDEFRLIISVQTVEGIYQIEKVSNIASFLTFRSLQCQMTINPIECSQLLEDFYKFNMSLVTAQMNLQFISHGDIINASSFQFDSMIISCFSGIELDIKKDFIVIKINKIQKPCWQDQLQDTNFTIQGFASDEKIFLNQSIELLKFQILNWNTNQLLVQHEISNQEYDIFTKNDFHKQYRVQITRDILFDSVNVNQYKIQRQQNLLLSIIFLVSSVVISIVVAIVLIIVEVCCNKKINKKKIKKTKKVQIEEILQ